MLTVVKNQILVCMLSVKYNIMREMLNKVTFLMNVTFMILNNASILIQWFVLFRLREDIGGYTMREVMLLWGLMAASFGLSHILFARVYSLPELIVSGKLDSYLVQPKNVLLGVMTSSTNISAIGDLLYGLILLAVCGLGVRGFLFSLLFVVTGMIILTAFALFLGSLAFWFVRVEMLSGEMVMGLISFATYPDGIFQGISRFLLYFIMPVGMIVYHPVHILVRFDAGMFFTVLGYACLLSAVAAMVFYGGLRRYASSSLMEARM